VYKEVDKGVNARPLDMSRRFSLIGHRFLSYLGTDTVTFWLVELPFESVHVIVMV
jgi:hypothetical protein